MRLFAETFTDCGEWDPRYWGYFRTFNEGRFYEAHDVLEDLWLECRGKTIGQLLQIPHPTGRYLCSY
jgi:predicted metal-dependent hydrolase